MNLDGNAFELSMSDTLGPLSDANRLHSVPQQFVDEDECARRMEISVERVRDLARRGVLRTDRSGNIQPAILSGVTE